MLNHREGENELARAFFGPDSGGTSHRTGIDNFYTREFILEVTASVLRELRMEAGKTTRGLADELGMYNSNITAYENMKRLPGLDTLAKLSEGFETPFPDLLRRLADEYEKREEKLNKR